jgi:hypothetical protein
MVIEEGLNQLPYTEVEVTTPTGSMSWLENPLKT